MRNKQRVAQSFARHFREYDANAHVQARMALILAQALRTLTIAFAPRRAMEIGVGTGVLARYLTNLYPDAQWWFNDISPEVLPYMPQSSGAVFLQGDAEEIVLPQNLDLIASSSAVQWMDNIPQFIARLAQALNPGGFLAIGAFAEHNLYQIRQITGATLASPCCENWKNYLRATGLQLVYAHDWEQTLLFPDMHALLRHLHSTGVNAASSSLLTREKLLAFCESYCERFADPSNRLPLTYHPIILLATVSENSQMPDKPAKKGCQTSNFALP